MTETRTLQFENPRVLQSLYANDIKLLKNLEDSLGVKVTTREGWVKLEGDPNRLDKAQQVFEQLEKVRQQGVDIQKHEFDYALKAVSEDHDSSRVPVGPGTHAERSLAALQDHPVVIAHVGHAKRPAPCGTSGPAARRIPFSGGR